MVNAVDYFSQVSLPKKESIMAATKKAAKKAKPAKKAPAKKAAKKAAKKK